MPRLAELLRQMEQERPTAWPPASPAAPIEETEVAPTPVVAVEEEEEEEGHHVHVHLTSEQLQRLIDAILPEVMSAGQLARYLQKGRDWVCKLARKGEIPAFKMGNSWRFLKKAVDEWLVRQIPSVAEDKSREHSNKW